MEILTTRTIWELFDNDIDELDDMISADLDTKIKQDFHNKLGDEEWVRVKDIKRIFNQEKSLIACYNELFDELSKGETK